MPQFIKVDQGGGVMPTFCRTEKEAKTFVSHLTKTVGIEQARNDIRITLVEIPANKDTLYDALNGTPVSETVVGEYYITPRGALKRDRDE